MLACFGCYFLQLFFGCSFTGSCKAFISNSFISKTAYGCFIAIHNNTACYYAACCYTAACPDSAFAAADAYKIASISFKLNIVIQSNIVLHTAVCSFFRGYSNISTISNNTVLFCFCFYIFQLAIVYCVFISFTVRYAADFTGIIDTNNTIDCGAAIQHNYRCLAVGDACNTCSQSYTGISVNYTGNIVQFTGKVNFYIVAIIANDDILMIAGILFTAEINGCFRCYLICCTAFSGKLPAFIGICSCFLQLAYVYCIGICFACCYIDNLTVSVFAAYGYCISSVSYAAGTQSNTAFAGNLCIMTENNSVINSCFGYFISRAENNVILTAYFLIITDNLVAVCGNFIFFTDYSNIRCIFNSILITVNKVILCSLSFSTGYLVLYTSQLGVFSVISLVAAADCHYRTTCIFAGLHSFNCFLLCISYRNIIPVGVNADFFNGVGNFVAGTPD